MLDTLRYDQELRDSDEIFSSLSKQKPRADMLAMAEQLIESRSEAFDPTRYQNHYAEALRDLVQTKVKSGGSVAVETEAAPSGAKVVDFMEALKRSLAGGAKKPEDKAAAKAEAKPAAAKPEKAKAAPAKPRPKAKPAPKRKAG